MASFSLGSFILFVCAFSRCLTISRLQLRIEARYKRRQGLEPPVRQSCIHTFYGPPYFPEAPAPLVCKSGAFRRGEGTHNFVLAKFTKWQSSQAR